MHVAPRNLRVCSHQVVALSLECVQKAFWGRPQLAELLAVT